MVLIVILVVMLIAVAGASRVRREARVTKLQEYSEQALYAAEMGFNVARSQLIGCGTPTAQSGELTFEARDGSMRTGGHYSVTVAPAVPVPDAAAAYTLVSTGTYGQEPLTATRSVRGTIHSFPAAGPCSAQHVTTTYAP